MGYWFIEKKSDTKKRTDESVSTLAYAGYAGLYLMGVPAPTFIHSDIDLLEHHMGSWELCVQTSHYRKPLTIASLNGTPRTTQSTPDTQSL
jgi:hypothetical protein